MNDAELAESIAGVQQIDGDFAPKRELDQQSSPVAPAYYDAFDATTKASPFGELQTQPLYHSPHAQMLFPSAWQLAGEELKLVDMGTMQQMPTGAEEADGKAALAALGFCQSGAEPFQPYTNATRCKKSGTHIKRPMNAFMVWSREKRLDICSRHPDKHNAEISKELGMSWKRMSREEKRPYEQRAEELRQLHMLEYPGYKYRPRKKVKKSSSESAVKWVAAQMEEPQKAKNARSCSSTSSTSAANIAAAGQESGGGSGTGGGYEQFAQQPQHHFPTAKHQVEHNNNVGGSADAPEEARAGMGAEQDSRAAAPVSDASSLYAPHSNYQMALKQQQLEMMGAAAVDSEQQEHSPESGFYDESASLLALYDPQHFLYQHNQQQQQYAAAAHQMVQQLYSSAPHPHHSTVVPSSSASASCFAFSAPPQFAYPTANYTANTATANGQHQMHQFYRHQQSTCFADASGADQHGSGNTAAAVCSSSSAALHHPHQQQQQQIAGRQHCSVAAAEHSALDQDELRSMSSGSNFSSSGYHSSSAHSSSAQQAENEASNSGYGQKAPIGREHHKISSASSSGASECFQLQLNSAALHQQQQHFDPQMLMGGYYAYAQQQHSFGMGDEEQLVGCWPDGGWQSPVGESASQRHIEQ